jgi:murein DD-endopeptidase MepM/ murein hydrolase activator NlpD
MFRRSIVAAAITAALAAAPAFAVAPAAASVSGGAAAPSAGSLSGGNGAAGAPSGGTSPADALAAAAQKRAARERAQARARALARRRAKARARARKRHHHTTPPPPVVAPPSTGSFFPIAGAHSYGGASARFGAPRGGHIHQGQDVMAAEGTPLVAPRSGTIRFVGNQPSAAGVYVVLHDADGKHEYALMHIQTGSVRVHQGQTVAAGDRIASVGHTGDAQGPHLHFEEWVGPWQTGGHAVDPLPLLKSWDTGA